MGRDPAQRESVASCPVVCAVTAGELNGVLK